MRLVLLFISLILAVTNAISIEKLQDLLRVRESLDLVDELYDAATNETFTSVSLVGSNATDNSTGPCSCDEIDPIAPCCQTLNVTMGAEGFNGTYTPGFSCDAKNITTCESCTDLAVCRWSEDAKSCKNQALVESTETYKFTDVCGQMGGPFQPAQLRFEEVLLHQVTVNGTITAPNSTYTETPVIAEAHEMGGCENIDYDKYPRGIPGCDSFVNENAGQLGVVPTDMISDARLPVASHIPRFPLAGNPNLPDLFVNGGGDWDAPQDPEGWTVPTWNHNGCLGGPCDEERDDVQHMNTMQDDNV